MESPSSGIEYCGLVGSALLMVLLITACTHQPVARTVDRSAEVRTYADYKEMLRRTAESVPLNQVRGSRRLQAALQRLAAINSVANQRYAREIEGSLRGHGVTLGPINYPAGPASENLAYGDLARIDVLTWWLLGSVPEAEEDVPRTIPLAAYAALIVAVAEFSPSDYGAYVAALRFFSTRPADVDPAPGGEQDRAVLAPAIREAHRQLFGRYTNRKSPWNVTSGAFFAEEPFFSEWGAHYISALDLAEAKRTLPTLVKGLAEAAKELRDMDASPEVQEGIQDFLREAGPPDRFSRLLANDGREVPAER